ncbi:MAG: MFS transporter [Alphaproteobacteria bacterium]|nr:MFS transporter [Alphaproteobacteria bacterium]
MLAARGIRAFADGFVSLILPIYLTKLGFDGWEIGAVITGTLLGSSALTLAVGMFGQRHRRRALLVMACVLMAATGLGFATVTAFWPLLAVAVIGTMNPSSGDSSVFLPLEQTALTQTVSAAGRTAVFARYSLIGTLMGAAGTLAAPLTDALATIAGGDWAQAARGMFLLYGALGGAALLAYARLSPAVEHAAAAGPQAPLGPSREIVLRLSVLFSLDSLGSGFFVQSLLALWLYQRFNLSIGTTASILFWSGLCSAISFLVAVPVAKRIGLINTMVFTHLPSSLFIMAVPFVPDLWMAIVLLLARGALSQMDVPTRNSYVMAVVRPEERAAAASVTAVAKSLASAIGPILAGGLLAASPFGWPLVIGGGMKAAYDLLLLAGFRHIKPPEEHASAP